MNLFVKQYAALATAFTVMITANYTHAAEQKNIVETAVEAGSFKTLATALTKADLVSALQGEGPFTVFAPTDEAFSKLPPGTVETLLKPKNKSKLVGVLTYHVVSGKVPAAKVTKLSGAETLNGQRVDIMTKDDSVMVDGATVVKADIKCSNGIIHVIDQVILPADKNLVGTASAAGKFNTLLTAATKAGLAEVLAEKGPFTIFAPTDDAFAQLPEGTIDSLLKPVNKKKLADILKYHVIAGRVYSDKALAAGEAKTLQGQKVKISASGGAAKVNQAKILKTDIDASNGVIHVIDAVILPPEGKKVTAREACHQIRETVAKGAHLYNSGHYQQSAKLYRKTMQSMLQDVDGMPTDVSQQMHHALTSSKRMHCASQQAWTLRNALDHAYARMSAL